jgi:hypothetical protein
MAQKVIPGGIPTVVVSDAAADDSDKSFAPSSERWRIVSVYVTLVASATAGNRQVAVRVLSGSDVLYQSPAGAVQAGSTTVNYNFAHGNARETAAVAGALDVPLPAGLVIGPGQTLQVLDTAAVDAAADDMTVRVLAEVY